MTLGRDQGLIFLAFLKTWRSRSKGFSFSDFGSPALHPFYDPRFLWTPFSGSFCLRERASWSRCWGETSILRRNKIRHIRQYFSGLFQVIPKHKAVFTWKINRNLAKKTQKNYFYKKKKKPPEIILTNPPFFGITLRHEKLQEQPIPLAQRAQRDIRQNLWVRAVLWHCNYLSFGLSKDKNYVINFCATS